MTQTTTPQAGTNHYMVFHFQIGAESPALDEYEDDTDDLEIQASEHEIEAVYSGSGAVEKPKKPKRRRRYK